MKPNTEDDEKDPEQNNFIKDFTINEIQDAIDRLKKGKAKDSNGIRAEQLKNCSDDTKENLGQSSTNLRNRKTSHQKAGENQNPGHFQKR